MISWKLLRLSLCLAAMVVVLGLGGYAWVQGGLPRPPISPSPYRPLGQHFWELDWVDYGNGGIGRERWCRTDANPFEELHMQVIFGENEFGTGKTGFYPVFQMAVPLSDPK